MGNGSILNQGHWDLSNKIETLILMRKRGMGIREALSNVSNSYRNTSKKHMLDHMLLLTVVSPFPIERNFLSLVSRWRINSLLVAWDYASMGLFLEKNYKPPSHVKDTMVFLRDA